MGAAAAAAAVLVDLVPVASEGPAAFHADALAAVAGLAVLAPAGPAACSGELLARLDFYWLTKAYAADSAALAKVRAAVRHFGDVRPRYETLFARLGPAFDGAHRVTDFDGLYCSVEATAGIAVAEAQAQALVELGDC